MSEITSMDMANVMGSFISTELDAFENLHKELEEKAKETERLNNIINKGIEYILGNDLDNFNNINNLLSILKGDDK